MRLLLRPEVIALAHPAGSTSEVVANVVSRTFLGEKIEYALSCAGETLQVARYNAGPQDLFHEGEAVALHFVDEAVIVLRDEEAP